MAARSSAGVKVRAGLKLRQLGVFTAREDIAYQVHQHKMPRDALLIAPSKEQPLGITASSARHMLGAHTNFWGKNCTLLGPAPAVPETATRPSAVLCDRPGAPHL